MSLLRYILRRFINALITMFIVIIVTFFLARALPGNPFILMITRPTPSQIARYEEAVELYGLNDPLFIQFLTYLKNILTNNWGTSWSLAFGRNVWVILEPALLIDFEIITISLVISFIIGRKLGIVAATELNSKQNWFFRILISLSGAIPGFVFAFFVIIFSIGTPIIRNLFGYKSLFFPDPPYITGARLLDCLISGNFLLFFDTAKHYFFPIIILSFQSITLISRHIRSSLIEVMDQDYIRTARAKGCTEKQIINNHAIKISIIPTITAVAASLPNMILSLALIEKVYVLRGFGNVLTNSIIFLDYNVTIASMTILVIIVVIVNFAADILYAILDPRIRYN